MQNLRQVLNLHDEFFTVIVKDEDTIKGFADIDGKKILTVQHFPVVILLMISYVLYINLLRNLKSYTLIMKILVINSVIRK